MDTYQKTETVEAEQWNKLGDVKEAGVKKLNGVPDFYYIISGALGDPGPGLVLRPGDYIVKAYDIKTDGTVYYPIQKEEFEILWSKVSKPAWEGNGDLPIRRSHE